MRWVLIWSVLFRVGYVPVRTHIGQANGLTLLMCAGSAELGLHDLSLAQRPCHSLLRITFADVWVESTMPLVHGYGDGSAFGQGSASQTEGLSFGEVSLEISVCLEREHVCLDGRSAYQRRHDCREECLKSHFAERRFPTRGRREGRAVGVAAEVTSEAEG